MDEIITDNLGGLSLNAKEWRPGLGFAPTPQARGPASTAEHASTSASGSITTMGAATSSRQVSAESEGSDIRGGSAISGESSWGGEQYSSLLILCSQQQSLRFFFRSTSSRGIIPRHRCEWDTFFRQFCIQLLGVLPQYPPASIRWTIRHR